MYVVTDITVAVTAPDEDGAQRPTPTTVGGEKHRVALMQAQLHCVADMEEERDSCFRDTFTFNRWRRS